MNDQLDRFQTADRDLNEEAFSMGRNDHATLKVGKEYELGALNSAR